MTIATIEIIVQTCSTPFGLGILRRTSASIVFRIFTWVLVHIQPQTKKAFELL